MPFSEDRFGGTGGKGGKNMYDLTALWSEGKKSIMYSFLIIESDISWPLDNLGGSTLSNAYLSDFLYQPIQQEIIQATVTPFSTKRSYF